jgi:hypothetical protein
LFGSLPDTPLYLYDRAVGTAELYTAMVHTRLVPLLATLVVLAGAFAGVAPAAASAQASASVGDYTVTRGDTVSMSVGHSAPANLTISGGGFEAVVELGGSGSHTVKLDTYASTGNASEFISGGSATLIGPPLNEALKPGTYTLEVTIDGTTEAYGKLTIRSNGEVTSETGVLPGDYFEEDSGNPLSAVQTHDEIGRGNQHVVSGDYAVFVVDENGSNIGTPFGGDASLSDLAGEGFEISVEELDPEPNTDAKTYSGERVTVRAQFGDGDGTLGVFFDTEGIDIGSESNHTYEFDLTVDEDQNPLFETDQTLLTERVTLVEPSVSIDAEPGYTLDPWDGDTIRVTGETNLLPGTVLNVRALQEPPAAKLWQDDTTVSADGTFETMFDFSNADRPSTFPLQVRGYDETKRVVRLRAANGSLLFPSQTVHDDTVTLENVTLSDGGFVRLTANNATVGVTDALQPVTNRSLTVPLNTTLTEPTNVTATAIVDADGDGELNESDPVYGSWNTPVRDTAVIQPGTAAENERTTATTTTANQTTTNNTTAAVTATKTTIQVAEADPIAPAASNDAGSSGGFVPLSPVTTLVALFAAALLVIRRGPDRL